MASNGNLSHSQIWDDSALVDSWNEALAEYKVLGSPPSRAKLMMAQKYHSIKARGQNVEEVLNESEEGRDHRLV